METAETVTTLNYEGTNYQDAAYEIVGQSPSDEVFVPMKLNVVKSDAEQSSDPMFSDYGGKVTEDNDSIWHLPEGVRFVSEEEAKEVEDQHQDEETKLQQLLEAARREGFEQAKAEAEAQSQEQYNERLNQLQTGLQTILKDLNAQLNERLRTIEKRAVQLAVNITEKLVPHAVEINPEYIVSILREGLELAATAVIKKIRVSPADLEFINVVGVREMLAEYEGAWEFVADDTIRAGCVIETSAGEVEFDLDSAWQRVKENIARIVR